MKQIVCDRCGARHDLPSDSFVLIKMYHRKGSELSRADLCGECATGFEIWLDEVLPVPAVLRGAIDVTSEGIA